MTSRRIVSTAMASTGVLLALSATPASAASPPLQSIIEDVAGAKAHRFQVRDNLGASMDGLKIVNNPRGGYIGVYHVTEAERIHTTYVATSPDMFTWTRRGTVSDRASMATMKVLSDGSVLVAEEADNNSSASTSSTWLRISHYPNVEALLAGKYAKRIDLPHTLAHTVGAEGTPDIRYAAADLSRIDISFHFLDGDLKVDRQARGILWDFSRWQTEATPWRDQPIIAQGISANIGDRDNIWYENRRIALVEAQSRRGDFGAWGIHLYDATTNTAPKLNIRTPAGSTSIANPSISLLTSPAGKPAIAVTLFIHQPGSKGNESGTAIYYREIAP